MMTARGVLMLTLGWGWSLFSQPTRPAFVAADIHTARAEEEAFWVRPYDDSRSALRSLPVRDGSWSVKGATMLDLVSGAYGWEPYKIVGGPSWLETDRFDITAKVANEAPFEDRKLMLQSLLEERFKLVIHEDMKPVAGYVLTAGSRLALKPAGGSGKTGCELDSGRPQTSSTVWYRCRNISMSAFAAGLLQMHGVFLAPGRVVAATGLSGSWDFDVHWGNPFIHIGDATPDYMTVFDALGPQLGLKLEEKPVTSLALVVVKVNRLPTPNLPAVAQIVFPPP